MTKEMATLLVLAQAASDVGKGITALSDTLQDNVRKRAEWGYPTKDMAIYKLLLILARNPQKDIHFYVCEDRDGVATYLVYFDFMLGSQKVQVSFHSFDKRLRSFLTGSVRSKTDWRSDLESRSMCFALAQKYRLFRPGFTVSPQTENGVPRKIGGRIIYAITLFLIAATGIWRRMDTVFKKDCVWFSWSPCSVLGWNA